MLAPDATRPPLASLVLGPLLVLVPAAAALSQQTLTKPAPEESPRVRLERAAVLLERGAGAEALGMLEPLVADVEAAGSPPLLVETLYHLGWAYLQLNEYTTSLARFGRALELSRELRDRRWEAQILWRVGIVMKNQGAYAEGLARSRESLAIHQDLDDRRGTGRAWIVIGAIHDLMGEYRQALEDYQLARGLLEASKDQVYFRLLNEIGITYKNLGRYEEALACYAAALAELRKAGDRYGQAMTLSNMGVAYTALGEDERAGEHYQQSLALCRELGERRGESIVLGNLAETWQRRGEPRRAVGFHEQQLVVAREIGNRLTEALGLEGLGDIRLSLDEVAQARELYGEALAILQQIGASARVGWIQVALVGVALREGRIPDALRLAEQALDTARDTGSPELEWQARLALGRVARATGDAEGALGHLREGVQIVNSVRGRVLTDTGKIGYLDARQALFHELVDVLQEKGRGAEALETAEAARSRAFSDLLAGRQVALKASDATPLAAIREAEARVRAQTRIRPTVESARAELTRTLAATEAELSQRLRFLVEERPELASLVVAEPASMDEIAGIVRRLRATVVEYLVTRKRLFIWIVSPAGEVHGATVEVGRDRLRQDVGRLHRQINDADLAALRDPGPVRERLAALHRLILAPVEGYLPRDPEAVVYVVPDDALFLVPFPALVDEGGRYAVETHTWVSTPSIAVLRYTGEKKQRLASPGGPRLLAFADPRAPDDAAVGGLAGARSEVGGISRRFPQHRRTVLLAEAASEANAKRLSGGQGVLHFAVHGLVDDERPWDSALILSAGEGEDGWLKVGEVFGLDLRADLVVLSGCSTGLGKVTGDGVLGLARAFFYAGAPSLIVSQWDVSDKATAFLMDRFYAELAAGKSKAHALRSAQLAAQQRFRHPALWAAFGLIGEAR